MMGKDWKGDGNSVYKTLGASNHTDKERQSEDYYATDPIAIDKLLNAFDIPEMVWECACGEGHLSKRLQEYGYAVKSTDLIYRGFGNGEVDFLKTDIKNFEGDIITNPPYKYALEFVYKAMDTVREGGNVAMFLRLLFLEGQKRRKLFDEYPPKRIHVFSSRIGCAKGGDFENNITKAVCFAWFVWQKGYEGETIIDWIK